MQLNRKPNLNHSSRGSRRRSGAAAVEMAFVGVLILIPIAYGMMEMTRAVQIKDSLTAIARSACGLGTLPRSSNSTIQNHVTTVATGLGLNSSQLTVVIRVNGSNVDASTAIAGDQISIKISIPAAQANWLAPMFLNSSSVESETSFMMRQG
jgi:Flp pilus assembly protein TadG